MCIGNVFYILSVLLEICSKFFSEEKTKPLVCAVSCFMPAVFAGLFGETGGHGDSFAICS